MTHLEPDKDKTHKDFLGQKVPLSERNQGDTDSASVSAQQHKKVSIFMDLQNQPIKNKDDLMKFLKDHEEKKKKKSDTVAGEKKGSKDQSLNSGSKETKPGQAKRSSTDFSRNEIKIEPVSALRIPIRKSSSKEIPKEDSGKRPTPDNSGVNPPPPPPQIGSTPKVSGGAPVSKPSSAKHIPAALFPSSVGSTKPKLPGTTKPTSTGSRPPVGSSGK